MTAYSRVLQTLEEQGEAEAKIAFRDAMLKLGHEERIKNLYRVNDKLTSNAVFFQPNAPQEEYLKTKTGRDIILKCRQVGFTTLSAVRALDKAMWEPNTRTGIMAHLQLTVGTIFNDLVKYTYEWFKRDWGHLYSPVEKSSNSTELAFSEDGLGRPLDSSMRVLFDFRGKTLNFLHVSEASRVEDDRLLGSLQGVPYTGEVILESTPNGRGGQFHRLWQSFRSNGQTAPYKGYFVPWFAFYPEVPGDWEPVDQPEWSPYEQTLLDSEVGITPSHLIWRRWCIEANCNGDPDQFENEYPTNDIDCFLTGEASVYPASLLKTQDKLTRDPSQVGFIIQSDRKFEFHADPKGYIAIWKKPEAGHTYVIGADAAGGVGKDKAAAYVKDRGTKELVARIWGDLEPADFANELFKIGSWYHKAWINPEINNHGHTVVQVLKEKLYPHIYKRTVLDEKTSKPTQKLGFQTTNDSKLRITERVKTSCNNGDLKIFDKNLIDEMSTFVQLSSKNGRGMKREAASGSHDDLVMAVALTEEMDQTRGEVVNTTESVFASSLRDVEIDPITGCIVG